MRLDLNPLQNRVQKNLQEKEEGVLSNKALYFSLLNLSSLNDIEAKHLKDSSISFLEEQLFQLKTQVNFQDQRLPTDEASMVEWLHNHAAQIGEQYQQYLHGRARGEARRYFTNKSHALFFIKSVAPTKMVDGAWLSGFIKHWKDDRFASLINIYLEELGDGVPEKNHVVLYRKLLNRYGFDQPDDLDDEYFVQGAIQLALGERTEHFLPETIGFNLGYEQLPLHLLITAYELKELGIDPYYFTLHITIDNPSSGHARQAVQAVFANVPLVGNKQEYFKRVCNGFQLNNAGVGTEAIIKDFDIENEFISILKRKASIGKFMHGNHCHIDGRSINDWLSAPEEIQSFITALEANHWIRRNEDPKASRFWSLIDYPKAMMFGVFSPYEKQVIYDWIAGEQLTSHADYLKKSDTFAVNKTITVNKTSELLNAQSSTLISAPKVVNKTNIFPLRISQIFASTNSESVSDFNQDELWLQERISSTGDKDQLMRLLSQWMTPAKHHTKLGLIATQKYKALLISMELV